MALLRDSEPRREFPRCCGGSRIVAEVDLLRDVLSATTFVCISRTLLLSAWLACDAW